MLKTIVHVPTGEFRSPNGGFDCGPFEPQRQVLSVVNGVTTYDPQGCAQGIYHEVGHLRLESLGMHIEGHDNRLILNGPEELYDSPVRFDKQRPMEACIHGLYAWIIFTENDLAVAKWDPTGTCTYLAQNVSKIEKGIVEVETHVVTTDEGAAFVTPLLAWGRDIVERSHPLLRATLGEAEYQRLCPSARGAS